jgi:hypothetical protein
MRTLIVWGLLFTLANVLPYLLLPPYLIEPLFIFIANAMLIIVLISLKSLYKRTNKALVPGMFFILQFFLFFYFGSLNLYLVKSVFPIYGGETQQTFTFWFCYFISFLLGYLFGFRIFSKEKYQNQSRRNFLFIPNFMVNILFIVATFFTFISITIIGFVPILHPELGTERFFSDIGILVRFWMFLMPIAILYFIRYHFERNVFFLILLVLCLAQMTFFYVRFNVFLTVFAIILFYFMTNRITRKFMFRISFLLIIAILFNTLFLDRREGKETLLSKRSDLNYFQTHIIYYTFNEFRQLNDLINLDPPMLYGKTLLAIPISFIPYQITDALMISKEEIKSQNSALILMELSDSDSGLRTGLAGELYINFRYYGLFISFLLGLLIARLDFLLKRYDMKDTRVVVLLMLEVTLFYGIFVGQIDAIGSYLFSTLLFYIVLRIVSRKSNVTGLPLKQT